MAAMNRRSMLMMAAVKVMFDHFVYFARPGCWSSNS